MGGGGDVNKRMTITEVAEIVGICPKTIVRWEKVGKVRRAKRDWRGWRIYDEHDCPGHTRTMMKGVIISTG